MPAGKSYKSSNHDLDRVPQRRRGRKAVLDRKIFMIGMDRHIYKLAPAFRAGHGFAHTFCYLTMKVLRDIKGFIKCVIIYYQ